MEYRTLGRSSLKVSALCLGTMSFAGRTDEQEGVRIVHAAMDSGINFIDTADCYAHGASEEIVGKALAQDGRRDQVILATKVTGPMGKGPNDEGTSRYRIMRSCEDSLRRLQTDRIDLYQIHYMDMATPLEESMRAMDDLVRQGKVLYVGCSKHAPAWTVEALMLCDRHGWSKFVSEQPPYNLLDRRIENEMVWTCMRHGIGIIPWGPIAAGILSGKYSKDAPPPEGSRFGKVGGRLNEQAIGIADALKPIAAEKGVTLAEFCYAWVMRQPGITAPIVGARTVEHITSALNALDVEFTDEDYERIDAIAPPGTAVSDYYDGNISSRLRRAVGLSK